MLLRLKLEAVSGRAQARALHGTAGGGAGLLEESGGMALGLLEESVGMRLGPLEKGVGMALDLVELPTEEIGELRVLIAGHGWDDGAEPRPRPCRIGNGRSRGASGPCRGRRRRSLAPTGATPLVYGVSTLKSDSTMPSVVRTPSAHTTLPTWAAWIR